MLEMVPFFYLKSRQKVQINGNAISHFQIINNKLTHLLIKFIDFKLSEKFLYK
jgi:hypothetical protein